MSASESIAKFTIAPNASLEEAAQKIEDNKYGTILVIDGGRVIGTVTDGDMRKALLRHRLTMIPVHEVMNTNFLSVLPGDKAAAKALFDSHFYLRLIPEVDSQGFLRGVVKRDDIH